MLEPRKHELRRKNIILASTSPRRSELLSKMGIEFEIVPSSYDESILIPSDFPDNKEYCKQLAYEKGKAIVDEVLSYKDNIDLIISADTIVEYEGKVFGKPINKEHADKMLTLLSGKMHKVISAVCIIVVKNKVIDKCVVFHEETNVQFGDLDPEMVRCYVETGEPMGKAGGYGIQGLGSTFISRIEGDYYNVMGLPVHKLSKYLCCLLSEMES